MPKIIFIDDEQDILEQYKNVAPKPLKDQDALQSMASEIFNDVLECKEEDEFMELEIFSATQGLDGIQIIERELKSKSPIEVAFIDMRMPPGIDGKETAKRIRALDSHIEIVIVTAYSDTRPEQLLKEIGMADKLLYLKKPFDISEIRQLIRNLTTKYRGERIKDEFIGNVTHELKTPLSSILGFSELMISEAGVSPSELVYGQLIHSNAQLMKRLVSDLIETLDVSKKELRLHKESINLTSLLKEVYASFKIIQDNKDISFNLAIPQHEIKVCLDTVRFKQVLYNIIGNALKFTQRGRVEISIEEMKNDVKLCVSDTGPGISPVHLEQVFEKFYRIENEHHSKPGLGLGLFIVKQILEGHAIPFKVDSQIEQGTCFTIHLNKEKKL